MNVNRADRDLSGEREQAAREQWERIGSVLRELAAQTDSDTFYRVEPGSDLAVDDERSHPYKISQIVGTSLVTSIDHLNAMDKLVRRVPEMTIYVSQALARSSIESAAVGLWSSRLVSAWIGLSAHFVMVPELSRPFARAG